jgi:hypothetical protein
MNKHIAIQANNQGFRALENFVEELSDSLQLEHTYYGNIMTSLTLLHELACENGEDNNMVVNFEVGHEGLMFDVVIETREKPSIAPDESTSLQLDRLTDRIKFDSDKAQFSLFFDTKSVFSLMAKKRAEYLKNYLKGTPEKISKHNDSLQGY